MVAHRKYSDDVRQSILEGCRLGLTGREIGQTLGMTKPAVEGVIKRMRRAGVDIPARRKPTDPFNGRRGCINDILKQLTPAETQALLDDMKGDMTVADYLLPILRGHIHPNDQ